MVISNEVKLFNSVHREKHQISKEERERLANQMKQNAEDFSANNRKYYEKFYESADHLDN
jgi:hypothetical protein